MTDTEFYLFVYDIHSMRTLRRVVKRLNRMNSLRIQKSVFEIQGDREDMEKLIKDVEKLVDRSTDKIAVIPLCSGDYDKAVFLGVNSRRPVRLPSFFVL